jgi:hypothetical protein
MSEADTPNLCASLMLEGAVTLRNCYNGQSSERRDRFAHISKPRGSVQLKISHSDILCG